MAANSTSRIFARPAVRWTSIAVAILAVAAVAGYFVFMHKPAELQGPHQPVTVAHTGSDALVAAANSAASREEGALCERALTRAQSFGIVPQSTTLTARKQPTETEGRYSCGLKSGDGKTYTVIVEQTCDDLADHACFVLRTVTEADGTKLFDRRV